MWKNKKINLLTEILIYVIVIAITFGIILVYNVMETSISSVNNCNISLGVYISAIEIIIITIIVSLHNKKINKMNNLPNNFRKFIVKKVIIAIVVAILLFLAQAIYIYNPSFKHTSPRSKHML